MPCAATTYLCILSSVATLTSQVGLCLRILQSPQQTDVEVAEEGAPVPVPVPAGSAALDGETNVNGLHHLWLEINWPLFCFHFPGDINRRVGEQSWVRGHCDCRLPASNEEEPPTPPHSPPPPPASPLCRCSAEHNVFSSTKAVQGPTALQWAGKGPRRRSAGLWFPLHSGFFPLASGNLPSLSDALLSGLECTVTTDPNPGFIYQLGKSPP